MTEEKSKRQKTAEEMVLNKKPEMRSHKTGTTNVD
jgi:hypothetical protein